MSHRWEPSPKVPGLQEDQKRNVDSLEGGQKNSYRVFTHQGAEPVASLLNPLSVRGFRVRGRNQEIQNSSWKKEYERPRLRPGP